MADDDVRLPTLEQIPEELTTLKRWCGFKFVPDGRKFTKPPHSPLTGESIGATAKWAAHWLTFNEARSGVERHGLDGLGFVFVKADGYVGLDFDNCRNKDTGEIDRDVQSWLTWFPDAYIEQSISGSGIHIICRGSIPKAITGKPIGQNGASVEIYDNERFFTISGCPIGGGK